MKQNSIRRKIIKIAAHTLLSSILLVEKCHMCKEYGSNLVFVPKLDTTVPIFKLIGQHYTVKSVVNRLENYHAVCEKCNGRKVILRFRPTFTSARKDFPSESMYIDRTQKTVNDLVRDILEKSSNN